MEQAAHSHPAYYQAFILRFWAERGSAGSAADRKLVWRFSLEPVAGGKRLGFSDLKTLASFLEHQTGRKGIDEE